MTRVRVVVMVVVASDRGGWRGRSVLLSSAEKSNDADNVDESSHFVEISKLQVKKFGGQTCEQVVKKESVGGRRVWGEVERGHREVERRLVRTTYCLCMHRCMTCLSV